MKIEFACQDLDSLEVKQITVTASSLPEAHTEALKSFANTRILSGKQIEGDVRELGGSTINTQRYLFNLASSPKTTIGQT